MKKFTLSLLIILAGFFKANGQVWTAVGTGLDGESEVLGIHNGELYVGSLGEGYLTNTGNDGFTQAGGVSAKNFTKWNGSSWSAVGANCFNPGFDYQDIRAIISYGGKLYVAGGGLLVTTTSVGGAAGIASFDGISWSGLGPVYIGGTYRGVYDGNVGALTVYNSLLYVSGGFSAAGASSPYRMGIASWDGANWGSVGPNHRLCITGPFGYGLCNYGADMPDAMFEYNGNLYIGGNFMEAGGVACNSIARFDGSNFFQLGSGITGIVNAIALYDGNLYVGGWISAAGGNPVNNIAKWNGAGWSAVGNGLGSPASEQVGALEVYNGELYATGSFTTGGGAAASYIAKWNGTAWSSVGSGTNGDVYDLEVYNGELYVAGGFTSAGGVANTVGIAKWGNGATPIELISFTGKVNQDNSVQLNWSANLESNIEHFSVERIKNDAAYKEIGTVPSENPESLHDYSFTDKDVLSGTTYYRLRIIEKDGSFSYSPFIEVSLKVVQEFEAGEIYPNPVTDYLSVKIRLNRTGHAADKIKFTIQDALGKTVKEKEVQADSLINNFEWDTDDLGKGFYVLKISGLSGTILRKFIKQ